MGFKKHFQELIRRLCCVNELFSRFIILFCIGYMVRVVERCMDIVENGGSAQGIIQYASMFFGGELVLLIAKRLTRDIGQTRTDCARIISSGKVDAD